MTWEDIERMGDNAKVSIAAGPDHHWCVSFSHGEFIGADLYETLRLEMQRRYRRATGEEHAVLTILNNPEAWHTADDVANAILSPTEER